VQLEKPKRTTLTFSLRASLIIHTLAVCQHGFCGIMHAGALPGVSWKERLAFVSEEGAEPMTANKTTILLADNVPEFLLANSLRHMNLRMRTGLTNSTLSH